MTSYCYKLLLIICHILTPVRIVNSPTMKISSALKYLLLDPSHLLLTLSNRQTCIFNCGY